MIPERKKILHIIQSLGNGGCENMLLRTLPLLDAFDHTILTLKNPGELAPQFLAKNIRVETLHLQNVFDLPKIKRLRPFVQEESPDIIITYLFHADALGRFFLRGMQVPIIPFLRTTYNHPRYWLPRLFEYLTQPLVPEFLANSEAVKNYYVHRLHAKPGKITVIPNGIDIPSPDTLAPDSRLKASLSLQPDDFIIVCVANLHVNKGHRFLLEAFENIYQKNARKNIKLLLVGDGPERENLERQAENFLSRRNILFLGRRTDTLQILKMAHLFVLPTLFEGMSNALMEAMAYQVAVITTAIKENKVLIEHGQSGILVPPKNSEALEKAIVTLLKDTTKREQLARNAERSIRENFSLPQVAHIWTTFLRNHS